MSFIHFRNHPQRRGIITEMYNAPDLLGVHNAVEVDSTTQTIMVLATANNTIDVKVQGTMTHPSNIADRVTLNGGSAVAANTAFTNTAPWPSLRLLLTTNTSAAKTASTLTQTAGVATFTSNAHGFLVGDVVTVAGANQAGYNGVKTITAKDTNTFNFAVDSATVTPATTGTAITASGHLRVYCIE